ncbi:MAG: hypothetical protein ABIW79_10600 [Gemmatimonas sp.]
MTRIQRTIRTAGLLAAVALTAKTIDAQASKGEMGGKGMSMSMPARERMMSGWPMASREAVMFMTKKYGAPAAMTADMAIWGKTGPWKRTIVYCKEHPHEFPMHHTDVMQQLVDYKAPAAMYDALAMYDGSVVLERTSGEISARCDKEGANFLALNLAHDIVTGKQTVDGARTMYGEQIMAMKAMKSAPYTERLMFTPMMGGTGDPDQALAKSGAMKSMK